MQIHDASADMTTPRRGRPPTGARKAVLQVTLDEKTLDEIRDAAPVLGLSQAALGGALIKGEVSLADVQRAAKKGKGRK